METSIFHLRLRELLLKESKIMAKTAVHYERRKRYLRNHLEQTIYRVRLWISREKDPEELARAKWELGQWLEVFKNKE